MNKECIATRALLPSKDEVECRILFARMEYLKRIYWRHFKCDGEDSFVVGPMRANSMTIFFDGPGVYCLVNPFVTAEDQFNFLIELEKVLLEARGRKFFALDLNPVTFLREEISAAICGLAEAQMQKRAPLLIAGLRKNGLYGLAFEAFTEKLFLAEICGAYYSCAEVLKSI